MVANSEKHSQLWLQYSCFIDPVA